MNLYALGINHETAPVDIRETVSFSADKILNALQELKNQGLTTENIILSTCNRSEIYFTVKDKQAEQVIAWLHQFFELADKQLEPYIYLYEDLEAVKHIMRVATGLNSLVLGEPQILGQLKDAYNLAQKSNTINHNLDKLFQHVFRTAKQVRTDTEIGSSAVSVAFAAVSLVRQFYGDMPAQTAVLVGAGETIELVARHLKEAQIGRIIIANRTLDRAQALAERVDGYAIELTDLAAHLHEADIIIASTGSPDTIIRPQMIENALKKRKNSPIFMVDIAVPRDIDANISKIKNTYLYSVDDLQDIIASNRQSRQDAAEKAEDIIELQANKFISQHLAVQKVNPIIKDFRAQAENAKQKLLAKAKHRLELGDNPVEILEKLAHQLTNKILHTPSKNLFAAGLEGNQSVIEKAENLLIEK